MIRCQRHTRRSLAWAVSVAGTIAAGTAQPAHAQQNADEVSASGPAAFEEITVTARRRDERVQTIPMAVTAFSQADLDAHHVEQFRDLGKLVPSLSVVTNGSDMNALYAGQVRIRGLPGAEVYFAEVPLGSTDRPPLTGLTHSLSPGYYFDLESIEIDKGAQGTFFGRPSIGGLIAIAPKKPTDRFEGSVETEFGDYGDRRNELALNLPVIADKLMVRISALTQQRDGYTRDLQDRKDLDNQNYYAWRIGVTLKPWDDVTNYFLYDGYWQDTNGSAQVLIDVNPNKIIGRYTANFQPVPAGTSAGCAFTVTLGGPARGPVGNLPGGCGAVRIGLAPGIADALARQQALGPRAVAGRFTSGIGKDYFYGFTDVARWDISDTLVIKNIAAARITKQLSAADFTNTGLNVIGYGFPGNNHGWNDNSAQYSEEPHLEGRALNGKLDWLIGGFLLFNHPLGYTTEVFDTLGLSAYNRVRETDRSQAAFVHGIYDLSDYIEDLKLSAGYRYTWDYASLSGSSTKPHETVTRDATGLPNDCFAVLSDRNCAKTIESHYNSPSWNLSLDYRAAPKTLVYVRAGNTYHPGGVNPQLRPPLDRFGSEHVTDVELGVKADFSFWDISARTNADIFHDGYRAIQVTQPAVVPSLYPRQPSTIQAVQFNAASAELEGVEIEQTLTLPFGVDLSGEGSYLRAHYNQYPTPLGGGNPEFQYVPRFAFSLTATYHLPVDESWGRMSAGLTWSWTGHQSISPIAAEPVNGIPHYDNLDLHADWTDIFGQPFDAAFFMTNAADNLDLTGASPFMTLIGITVAAYSQPRMFGFSLKYRFGPYD